MPSSQHAAAGPTVLVTGGAGFIGSNFVRRLLESEPEVRVVNLDLLTYAGHLESLADLPAGARHEFVYGDIGDAALVQELLQKWRPTAVFNIAAESHVDRSIDSPDEFIRTNVVGTGSLLRNAQAYWERLDQEPRERFRFLHISTDEVYGSLGPTGRFTEASQYRPNSPYSASKAASDHLVRSYHVTYGLPTLVSNCSNNYGPNQFPEKLIPLMTLNALEGKPLPIFGDGRNVRDWLFVTDHCDALLALWRKGRPGEVYNVGGDAELTNLDVVRTICRVVDELCPGLAHGPSEGLIEHVQDRPGHDFRYAIDATKVQSETDWRPSVTFAEGIRQTVAWYLQNLGWVESVSTAQDRRRRGIVDGAS